MINLYMCAGRTRAWRWPALAARAWAGHTNDVTIAIYGVYRYGIPLRGVYVYII